MQTEGCTHLSIIQDTLTHLSFTSFSAMVAMHIV